MLTRILLRVVPVALLFGGCGKDNSTNGGNTTTFTLTVSATNGTVTKSPNLAAYDSNSVVQLTATPANGYHFVSWSGDTTETANPLSIRMNSNKNLTVNFAINTYTLTVNAGTGGTVTPSGATTVNHGAATPITATPDSGYRFVRWTRSGTSATIVDSTLAATTVYMIADATITAEFAINHVPYKPSNPSPTDGATDQNRTLQFGWAGGDADAGDTLKYDVYLDTVNPPVIKVSSAQTGTSYNASGLSGGIIYYWLIVATDGIATTHGDVWHFTTLPASPAGMKLISGGTFQMGDTLDANEKPVHSVTLSAFYMDTTEVTQADYLAIMLVNPSYFDSGSTWPVDRVTWFDAVLYCNARSKRDGKDTVYSYTSVTGTPGNGCTALGGLVIDTSKHGYRLSTEAEWEYACRAETTTEYYWGGSYPLTTAADTVAIDNNAVSSNNSVGSTARVAIKLPNAYGLYDMSGNVWEWCNDWYGGYNILDQINPTGAPTGTARVLRGCSWGNRYYVYFRSAVRGYDTPESKASYDYPGFRCVLRS
jgi:formylglycine-generating enzyme